MKRNVLIVVMILACTLALPLSALADDATLPADTPHFDSTTQRPATSLNDQPQSNLFKHLIAQEVTYQLDSDSALKFSCNVAALSGTDLAQDYDQYASAAPDIQVELVVRF